MPAADTLEVPQNCESVDKHKVCKPSPPRNDHDRAESFRTPREDDKWSRRRSSQHLGKNGGGRRETGERRASWGATRSDSQGVVSGEYDGKDGRSGLVEGPHRRCSSHGEKRQQCSTSSCTKRRERHEKERIRPRKEKTEKPGRQLREGQAHRVIEIEAGTTEEGNHVKETAVSPTSCADDDGDNPSAVKIQPPCRRKSLRESDARKKGRENVADEKGMKFSDNEDLPATGLDAAGLKDMGSGTDGQDRVVVHIESRFYASENEQVETIELGEDTRHVHADVTIDLKAHRATGKEQQRSDGSILAGMVRCTNQEDSEGGEEIESDVEVPQLELGNVEGHLHILQPDAEAEKFDGSVPLPKEFLKQPSLKLVENEPREVGKCPGEAISADSPKSVSHRRRRSAADLEWSDKGGTPDVRLVSRESF